MGLGFTLGGSRSLGTEALDEASGFLAVDFVGGVETCGGMDALAGQPVWCSGGKVHVLSVNIQRVLLVGLQMD